MARAAGRGFSVTRPYGDSASYDVGVEHEGIHASAGEIDNVRAQGIVHVQPGEQSGRAVQAGEGRYVCRVSGAD